MDMTSYAAGVEAAGSMLITILATVIEQFTLYETLFAFFAVALLGIAVAVGGDLIATVAKDMLTITHASELNDVQFHENVKELRKETNLKWYFDDQLQYEYQRNMPWQEYVPETIPEEPK